jgi:hypothetical protein
LPPVLSELNYHVVSGNLGYRAGADIGAMSEPISVYTDDVVKELRSYDIASDIEVLPPDECRKKWSQCEYRHCHGIAAAADKRGQRHSLRHSGQVFTVT